MQTVWIYNLKAKHLILSTHAHTHTHTHKVIAWISSTKPVCTLRRHHAHLDTNVCNQKQNETGCSFDSGNFSSHHLLTTKCMQHQQFLLTQCSAGQPSCNFFLNNSDSLVQPTKFSDLLVYIQCYVDLGKDRKDQKLTPVLFVYSNTNSMQTENVASLSHFTLLVTITEAQENLCSKVGTNQ